MTLDDIVFLPQGTKGLNLQEFDCGRESVNDFFAMRLKIIKMSFLVKLITGFIPTILPRSSRALLWQMPVYLLNSCQTHARKKLAVKFIMKKVLSTIRQYCWHNLVLMSSIEVFILVHKSSILSCNGSHLQTINRGVAI